MLETSSSLVLRRHQITIFTCQLLCRLSQVTNLTLHGGILVSQLEESPQLAALQVLSLDSIEMSSAWLRIIYASSVKDVEFAYCGRSELGNAHHSAGMLRSINLNPKSHMQSYYATKVLRSPAFFATIPKARDGGPLCCSLFISRG